jgi:hypothetical protein
VGDLRLMREHLITDQPSHFKATKDVMTLDLTKKWVVTIKRYRKPRSLSQNALLHSWIDIIADHTGHDQDEIKGFLKDKFLPLVEINLGKRARLVRASTARLATEEMSKFMDKIYAFAATDLGLTLPSPQERT